MSSKLHRELRRAVDNHKFEQNEQGGLFFPKAKLELGGVFDIQKNDGPREFFANLIVDEFRTRGLAILFGATAKDASYYLAPFGGNVTPTASWTASNFTANSSEFTNYDEAARVLWDTTQGVSSFAIGNSNARATFTIAAGAQTTIWGAGLLSASAKSATSGALVAASKATAARDNLADGDIVTIGYTITLNDAS